MGGRPAGRVENALGKRVTHAYWLLQSGLSGTGDMPSWLMGTMAKSCGTRRPSAPVSACSIPRQAARATPHIL